MKNRKFIKEKENKNRLTSLIKYIRKIKSTNTKLLILSQEMHAILNFKILKKNHNKNKLK
jgi:hypothetical protein